MVNAQTWLNGKFPNQDAKIKVNTLNIFASSGTESISGNSYTFYNAQLEGELDLSNFINLNTFQITSNGSNYHKLNLLKLVNCDKLTHLYLCYNDGQLSVRGNGAPNNYFNLSYCQNLSNFQFSDQFADIKLLYIQHCQQLTTISKLDRLVNLSTLNINNNPKLTNLEGLIGLEKLQTFTLSNCSEFERLTGLDKLISLKNLTISTCSKFDLSKLDNIPAGVTNLNISYLNSTSFSLNLVNNLTNLNISYCSNLKEIDLDKLPRLTNLTISNCPNLEKISGLEHSAYLCNINCQNCPKSKPFMHYVDWGKEARELRKLSSLIFPNSTYNFANLKEEFKRLKINDSTPLFQNKSRELKELITNAKNKLSEEAKELPEVFLDLYMELTKDIDNNFLQKQSEKIKNSLNKKLSEQEINSLIDKQTEVIKLKKQLEDLELLE